MHLVAHTATGFVAAPSWQVAHGGLIVGPVSTELLVKGVLAGRIPRDCRVRPVEGGEWRGLEDVREVRAAEASARPPDPTDICVRRGMRRLAQATSALDVCVDTLRAACVTAGASVGLLYRLGSLRGPHPVVARFGPPGFRTAEHLPSDDAALECALRGEPLVIEPTSDAAPALGERLALGGPPVGLALLPLRTPLGIAGAIELGRFDHGFRSSDLHRLVPLLVATVARLEELPSDAFDDL